MKILSLSRDLDEYAALLESMKGKSVYMLPSYLRSVQLAEGHPIEIMVYRDDEKVAMVPYVRRRINDLPIFKHLKRETWDIVTPHEYCCALANVDEPAERDALVRRLFEEVAVYCEEVNIVSEFFRFDPFLMNIESVLPLFDLTKACDNIYIDLDCDGDAPFRDFDHSVRKNIKRAASSGLKFCHAEKSEENVSDFTNLYWTSMRRLGASEYFYFSEAYFRALIMDCEGAFLFIIRDSSDRSVAASIVLSLGGIGHHHLTGYEPEATQLRPNDFMIYSLIRWGEANGLRYLHLGGGIPDICKFKGKFSKKRLPYYVGRRVHRPDTYRDLCDVWREWADGREHQDYFPLYRAGIK